MADPSKHNSPRRLIILLALLFLILLGAGYGTYKYYQATTGQVAEVPKIKTKPDIKKTDKTTSKKQTDEEDISAKKKELIEKIPNAKIAEKLMETDKNIEKATKLKEKDVKEILEAVDKEEEKEEKAKDKKIAKAEEEIDLSNPLNQMPKRLKQIQSYFAPEAKSIISVDETSFKSLQEEAFSQAGKYNPFMASNVVTQTPDIEEGKLPEIFDTTEKLSIIPEGKAPKAGFEETIQDYSPKSLITSTTLGSDTLDTTKLTGIIGNAAVLKFNGNSRALRAGQNYRGIVVLSVESNSVTLELNGYTVTKTLKN